MTAPTTRPGVEASGRSFRTISEGLGVEALGEFAERSMGQ